MNLKQLKQSELKRFEKKLDIRNDCSNVKDKHDEYCQGCVLIAVEEVDCLKEYFSSAIEKAFALGKEKGYWNRKADDKIEKEMLEADEAHRTKEGWCCACGYDMAVLEEKIAKEKHKMNKEILAGLPKKRKLKKWAYIDVKDVKGYKWNLSVKGFNEAIDQVINLLKQK